MAKGNVKIKMHRLVESEVLSEEEEVAMQSGLDSKILKDVSRSFYLSLRFLPKSFRPAASVGYLLARISDTFADATIWSIQERRDYLESYRRSILEGGEFCFSGSLDGLPEGEAILLKHIGNCQEALSHLPQVEQKAIKKVVGTITEGQKWDLVRFDGSGIVSLNSQKELRNYTYQVAGCVGEFWTEIGFETVSDFARASRAQMNEWGRLYGHSLQLINIIRDAPEDWANGRCYLPGVREQRDLMIQRDPWIQEALECLEAAESYSNALNGKRLRFATLLPALIGKETLLRLQDSSWDEWRQKVKVSRSKVRQLMIEAVRFAL